MNCMGNNSIRTNLSKEDIISDIKLMQSSPTFHQSIFLVVEGRDDIIFLQKRVKSDVNLYESFSGCCGVREIVEFFSTNNVIGICDRDYDNDYDNERVFFYDYNCLEMMLISNDAAFKSVYMTCYAGALPFNELRLRVLNDLKLISILRKINFDQKIGINFDRMSIVALYNKRDESIDATKIKDSIQNDIILDKRTEIAQLSSRFSTYEQLLQITNGHDFISYLRIVFESNKPPKSRSLANEIIFMLFTTAFREEDFARTAMYESLKEFESKYHLSVLN